MSSEGFNGAIVYDNVVGAFPMLRHVYDRGLDVVVGLSVTFTLLTKAMSI